MNLYMEYLNIRSCFIASLCQITEHFVVVNKDDQSLSRFHSYRAMNLKYYNKNDSLNKISLSDVEG